MFFDEYGTPKALFYITGFAVIVAFVFVIVFFFSTFVTVGAGERGVVTKWDRVQDFVLDEGLHMMNPFSDDVIKFSVRVQKTEMTASAGSRDMQKVGAKIAINWQISKDRTNKFYQELRNTERFEQDVLIPMVEEAVKASTSKKSAEELITQRASLKEDIDGLLKKQLKPYPVKLIAVNVVDLKFSEAYEDSIEQKAIADQNRLKAETDLKRIETEAKQKIARANADAESIRVQGKALLDNPALVDLKAVEKWNGVLPTNMYGNTPFVKLVQ